ncbi:MAG TPA: dipeptidase [Gemmatimonadaceae bacterium]
MRASLSLALLFSLACASGSARTAVPASGQMTAAGRALAAAPVFDGHNDLPWEIRNDTIARKDPTRYDLRTRSRGHTDIARLRAGRVGAQFWSVYVPGDYADSGYARVQLEQIDIARRAIQLYPDAFELALTADDVVRIQRSGKIASLLGMEGGHAIENSLGALRAFRQLGAAYMTLTHNVTLDWVDSGMDSARHGGLTAFGREVVGEMNRLGMLVDLSHVSDATMSDALDASQAPVIFSHSSARALTNVPRNVPDSILRRMPANGGVVMITFVPGFVSQEVADYGRRVNALRRDLLLRFPGDSAARVRAEAEWVAANPSPRATVGHVADHIEHVRRVAGMEHVGIGGDFDGISTVPIGLEDVSTYPALFAELERRGWGERDMRMLASENILRVMRAAEAVAARLQRERGPSYQTIEELDRRARR